MQLILAVTLPGALQEVKIHIWVIIHQGFPSQDLFKGADSQDGVPYSVNMA